AELFAALGDPTRLRIVAALANRELCVCDLAATIGQSESAVSHQLRNLRALGLVRSRREGRLGHYALDDHHLTPLSRPALARVGPRRGDGGSTTPRRGPHSPPRRRASGPKNWSAAPVAG